MLHPFLATAHALRYAKLAAAASRSLPWVNLARGRLSGGGTQKKLHALSRVLGGSVVVFSSAALVSAINQCPYSNRWRLSTTSPAEDVEMGNLLSQKIRAGNPPILRSTHPLTRILQAMVDRISATSDFTVHVVSDACVNAMALPNREIFVHAGLIASLQSRDELAGVLAHEIAHVLCRHSSEVVTLHDFLRIPSGFLYSTVAVSGGSFFGGIARWLAVRMVGPEKFFAHLPFSRKLEAEADLVGLQLMAKAGFDPTATLVYWERVGLDKVHTDKADTNEAQTKCKSLTALVSTHPPNAERLEMVRRALPEVRRMYVKRESEESWWQRLFSSNQTRIEYWIGRLREEVSRS